MARPAQTEAERETRMRDIRAAALEIFSARGFSAARLDDVAQAAGVAKGTIYLYFRSKEELFESIISHTIGAKLTEVEAALAADLSAPDLLRLLLAKFADSIEDPERSAVLQLVFAEGARFPAIADFYHREVISRGTELIRRIAVKGRERGEFHSDAAERFPMLTIAPAVLASLWSVVFARCEGVDARALLEAHAEILLRGLGARPD